MTSENTVESSAQAEVAAILRDHWPDPVFGCECTPVDEETGQKAVLGESWETHAAALVARAFPSTGIEWGVRSDAGGAGTATYGPYSSREAAEEVRDRLVEGGGWLTTRRVTEWRAWSAGVWPR